ncbi:hypothetical protein [Sulfuriflexus sp.]|uniref:hypothetical protein n=1 Tax=Sulfuriflexus sp. TaxID=2015443 RepID=UPI0028CFC478|nr:hypothetical protein [Sulfuriflexus sp.]MDT8403449.1 hypothetical protein [Sulfuriflexus sp.]
MMQKRPSMDQNATTEQEHGGHAHHGHQAHEFWRDIQHIVRTTARRMWPRKSVPAPLICVFSTARTLARLSLGTTTSGS